MAYRECVDHPHPSWRLVCSFPIVLAASLLVSAGGCGARTGVFAEPCAADAGTRVCETVCGAGTQSCVDGTWSRCEVPPTERPCANACGTGRQVCDYGAWQACEVPPTERACTSACGAGLQACVDGTWSTCDVPPAERACEATCGPGRQACIDGAWQACDGPATAERPCTDACGTGLQLCTDGVWRDCDVLPAERTCATPCGEGTQTCVDGAWGRCTAMMARPPALTVRVRDFHASHPDFESVLGDDHGIVQATLGADDKPVYAGPTPTTHGRMAFDQWYRDVPGVNVGTSIDLVLRPSPRDPGLFVYDDATFFPIDGMLFGNEGNPHNYHFTLEAETAFIYSGGEIFRFRGDDDVFVFINRRLVIDLGGVHGTEEATVDLDSVRAALGLVIGERYPIHLFFAERHTTESTFTVETTVADPIRCD